MTDNQDLTLQQASDYSGYSVSWLRKRILNDELPATKEKFKFGERWKVNKKDLDDIDNTAKISKEVVEVREQNKLISKEDLINTFKRAINERDDELIEKVSNRVDEKLDHQEKAIDEQRETIKTLVNEIKELKQLQQRSLFDKIKDLFVK